MNDKDDGGAAFPQSENWRQNSGMSLRDYFAAKAIQGFAAVPEAGWKYGITRMAKWSYEWADAMIEARKQ